ESQEKSGRRKSSVSGATVSSSEVGRSAPTACARTHEVVDPPSEFAPASGTPRRERGGNSVAKGGMSGDLARCANPATSGRCSVRNFGEYAFLEDSRYAS